MVNKELYLYHCNKLEELLEADQIEIFSGLQGDFLYEYRKLVEKEKEGLKELISQIKHT